VAASRERLREPPGVRVVALGGDRKGQHSIRITDEWRIWFVWQGAAAHQVEVVDYH
ncbi:MAG: type II toxin-antitoxin system RelE/ParE family toxin, partial [Candidatus Sericytochromatia bacterium]|nr:type II toxin-antitoxin system RelE/ParE family toxin [Candidatus Sericytochromatia bacterium]